MSESLPTPEEKLIEAKRLARLGFFRRAKDILLPLAETNEQARMLLQEVEKRETRFEKERSSVAIRLLRREKRLHVVIRALALFFGIGYLISLASGNVRPDGMTEPWMLHCCGIAALLTGLGIITFRGALVALDKVGIVSLPPDDFFDDDFLL